MRTGTGYQYSMQKLWGRHIGIIFGPAGYFIIGFFADNILAYRLQFQTNFPLLLYFLIFLQNQDFLFIIHMYSWA
jgi:hypothetical protein